MQARAGGVAHETPRGVDRRGARSDVLVIGEVVEEVAHNQVKVAVAVPVVEHRHRIAEHVHRRLILQTHHTRYPPLLGSVRARLVPDPIHVAVDLPVLPVAVFVVGVVPAVLQPVADAHDQVVLAVAVVVGEPPHVAAHAVVVDVPRQTRQRLESFPTGLRKLPRDLVLAQHRHASVGIGLGRDVAASLADFPRGLEDGERVFLSLRRRVLEVPSAAPRGDAPVGDDEVEVAVAVVVERHRVADQSGLEVGRSIGVVVFERHVIVRALRIEPLVRKGLSGSAQACGRGDAPTLRRAVERLGEVQQVTGTLHTGGANHRLAGIGVPRDNAARVVRETRLAVHERGGEGVLDRELRMLPLRGAGDEVDCFGTLGGKQQAIAVVIEQ